MRCYLATWTWRTRADRRQEVTMTFWAHDEVSARHVAHTWWDRVEPSLAPVDFTFTDLSAERSAP